jgi:hypothetical protein
MARTAYQGDCGELEGVEIRTVGTLKAGLKIRQLPGKNYVRVF